MHLGLQALVPLCAAAPTLTAALHARRAEGQAPGAEAYACVALRIRD